MDSRWSMERHPARTSAKRITWSNTRPGWPVGSVLHADVASDHGYAHELPPNQQKLLSPAGRASAAHWLQFGAQRACRCRHVGCGRGSHRTRSLNETRCRSTLLPKLSDPLDSSGTYGVAVTKAAYPAAAMLIATKTFRRRFEEVSAVVALSVGCITRCVPRCSWSRISRDTSWDDRKFEAGANP
jgi:hypothetical protein